MFFGWQISQFAVKAHITFHKNVTWLLPLRAFCTRKLFLLPIARNVAGTKLLCCTLEILAFGKPWFAFFLWWIPKQLARLPKHCRRPWGRKVKKVMYMSDGGQGCEYIPPYLENKSLFIFHFLYAYICYQYTVLLVSCT